MPGLATAHRRRLREIWRSAGWPCRDTIEVELLAAGLLMRQHDSEGRETLRVTDAGVQVLAASLQKNREVRNAHEDLVARVALEMQRAGRVVWRGLSLRAPLPGENGKAKWAVAMPDVYSIRHTTVEDYTEPIVHEIKVSRADLVADLRRPAKAAAYLALSSQCWYVLRAGIGRAEEIPAPFGVMVEDGAAIGVLRAAPRRPMRVPFSVWMALARAVPEPQPEDAQALMNDDSRWTTPGGEQKTE